jgi:hypothetical protein
MSERVETVSDPGGWMIDTMVECVVEGLGAVGPSPFYSAWKGC